MSEIAGQIKIYYLMERVQASVKKVYVSIICTCIMHLLILHLPKTHYFLLA